MLTPDGASLLWEIAVGATQDSLADASVVVSDGTLRAQVKLDTPPIVEGGKVTLVATFGEEVANFTWASAEVLSASGVVIDRAVADNGRKTAGAVWTIKTVLDLTAAG